MECLYGRIIHWCLYIPDKYVEDLGRPRKITNCHPIDTVELEAVLRGMNALLMIYLQPSKEIKVNPHNSFNLAIHTARSLQDAELPSTG